MPKPAFPPPAPGEDLARRSHATLLRLAETLLVPLPNKPTSWPAGRPWPSRAVLLRALRTHSDPSLLPRLKNPVATSPEHVRYATRRTRNEAGPTSRTFSAHRLHTQHRSKLWLERLRRRQARLRVERARAWKRILAPLAYREALVPPSNRPSDQPGIRRP